MKTLCVVMMSLTLLLSVSHGQQTDNSNIRKVALPMPADQLIHTVAAKETEFAAARNQYLYHQEVTVNELGIGNVIVGQYYRVSEVVFDDPEKGPRKS